MPAQPPSDIPDETHRHDIWNHPGKFRYRPTPLRDRDFTERSFTVGVGGPVGSGKTALMLALCQRLRESISVCAVTNDIFTREDAEFLTSRQALDRSRIRAVETGGCPHAAIREDISANLLALENLTDEFHPDLLLLESGGDNLAAHFSRELADFTIYVIDVAGGDKIPRKGGPGITQSDLLVINKTDLADAVGADLAVMDRDAKAMRDDGPYLFAQIRHGNGVPQIINHIHRARLGAARPPPKCDADVPNSTTATRARHPANSAHTTPPVQTAKSAPGLFFAKAERDTAGIHFIP